MSGHPTDVRLTEAEREALIEAVQNGEEAAFVESILAARADEADYWRRRFERMRLMYRERFNEGLSTAEWHAMHCAAAKVLADHDAGAAVARDEADRLRERLTALHQPIRVYDECEHSADHGCEPVEVYDYVGCSESVIGWGCVVCCYDDEYPREDCPHGADHRGVPREASCPTHALIADPAPEASDRD